MDNNERIAPGISNKLSITYSPNIYKNVTEQVTFKNNLGKLKDSRHISIIIILITRPLII